MSKQELDALFGQIEQGQISVDEGLRQIKQLKDKAGIETYTYNEACLRDHVISGKQILIGATHASLAINDFFRRHPEENSVRLQRLSYFEPVIVAAGGQAEVLLTTTPQQDTTAFEAKFRAAGTEDWKLAASGSLQPYVAERQQADVEQLRRSLQPFHALADIYTMNADAYWGDSYRTISQLYTGDREALSEVTIAAPDNLHSYTLHPLITNSALLTLFPLLTTLDIEGSFLPFGIKEIRFTRNAAWQHCWVSVKLVKYTSDIIIFDATVISDDGEVLISYEGYSLKKVRTAVPVGKDAPAPPVAVQPLAAPPTAAKSATGLEAGIIAFLLGKLRKIGGVKIAGPESNLMEAGIDSSQLVNIANMLAHETGLELNPTLFFEYPNVKELAAFFCTEYPDAFQHLLDIPVKKTAAEKTTAATAPVSVVKNMTSPLPPASPAPQRGSRQQDVAIIGMHGIFAGAENLEQFWENLRDGKDLISEIPPDHWDYRPWFNADPEAADSTYCKWGSFIKDVDKFDAGFFKISPREADWMDPQLRLLLQSIYNTGEDAGYINQLKGTDTGVFVGVCFHDYLEMINEKNLPADPYIGTGNGQTVTANRVSFYFDFKGPSIAYNTACSSSLSAVHSACLALHNNECSMAFVAGVNLLFSSAHYRYFSSIGALSPTGHCYSFDEKADGYVPGEAIATILIKPLEQAERDGDRIYGVIKGSAALHGGYTPSLTAPSVAGEENVLLKAWENAGISPETISYIEAHGTGTKLGDPIEINSLKKAFKRFTGKEQFCAVGSAKANIGHVEGASGMAGIFKVILQMQHRQLPAMPLFTQLNSYIQLERSALYINREPVPWEPPAGIPRRAGISSFGFSGAYAHVVIEEYTDRRPAPQGYADTELPAAIPLSARNEDRLRAQAAQLLAFLKSHACTDEDLPGIAYTLQTGREAMDERAAFLVTSVEQLQEQLEAYLSNNETLYAGHAKHSKDTILMLAEDEDIQVAIDTWISKGKYDKLLNLWVKGYAFDWRLLYTSHADKPRRISLPGYPFAKERYWVPETESPLPRKTAPATPAVKQPAAITDTVSLPSGLLTLTPVWNITPVTPVTAYPVATQPVLIAGGTTAERAVLLQHYPAAILLDINDTVTVNELVSLLPGQPPHIIWVAPESGHHTAAAATLAATELAVMACFRLIKALLQKGYASSPLSWTLLTRQCTGIHAQESVEAAHAALHGLAGSMAKEYPHWQVRIADLPAGTPIPWEDISVLPADAAGNAWAYRDGQWYRQELALLEQPAGSHTLYREGGVYVVIGGAGGIGTAWSEYMIRTYNAQIIWIGRRKKDDAIQVNLESLAAAGKAPVYIQADAADYEQLAAAYQQVKSAYGEINGVVNAAIVLADQSLSNMEEAVFRQALAAKVRVSVRIAEVFGEAPLDFLLFFSSIISFFKTPGQSNYAAGSTFEDAFAQQLSRQYTFAVKTMNWGYWGSIGIVAGETYRQKMAATGMGSIEPPEAMEALEQLLTAAADQAVFMKILSSGVEASPLAIREKVSVYERSLPAVAGHMKENMPLLPPQPEETLLQSYREMDALLATLLWAQLQSMNLLQQTTFTFSAWQRQVQPAYHRWLEQSLAFLVTAGFLEQNGNTFTIKEDVSVNTVAAWEMLNGSMHDRNKKAQLTLAAAMLKALPAILTGGVPATDIMFPQASMELVEGIYRGNTVADYFNEVLAQTVLSFIDARLEADPASRLRILEIGAGTGGTSNLLFDRLKAYTASIAEYCYTDISKAFLIHAENTYAAKAPYLVCKIFDTAQPLSAQGFAAAEYDLVIAANVLHATGNIHHTLRNAKALLAENGLLVLNELSMHTLFAHLTFGLLDGWWLYEDTALRIPGCPGLYPDTWDHVLSQAGFREIIFPAAAAHHWGQQIIAAESDGVVRQPAVLLPVAAEKPQPPAAPEVRVTDNVTVQREETTVRDLIVEKLGLALKISADKIDPDEPFADYGLDSITGVKLVQLINEGLQLQLSTTTLFDYSTVSRLAAHISAAYPAVVVPQSAGTPAVQAPPAVPPPVNIPAPPPVVRRQQVTTSPGKATVRNSGIKENKQVNNFQKEPVAIVGISGRFPQSDGLAEFWEHLAQGNDLVEKVTRWDLDAHDADFAANEKACRYGGFLRNIDRFDASFFNISGLEATYMDPQQRLFLEESWKALEDAGYAGSNMEGRLCGVYVGYNGGGYNQLFGNNAPAQAFWGNAGAVIPARISYYLDLQGPAIAVDTACSSSLVSIHLACQGLWSGETEMALAGGVFIQTVPWFYISGNRAEMLSPTGRCYTFDDRADGFVPAEGVGVVVLKRLKDALADGDHIHGVISASGINQDGTTNGITAPSARSQERLECEVYNSFNIHPGDIQLMEAHGTGTRLGDPIEFEALTRAFKKYTDKQAYCAIGSVKTNIGHAAAAAGMAGLFKVLLSLKHKKIPPSLHFRNGNAGIQFTGSPFYVNTTLKDWSITPAHKRAAAVSAFGFSGTNAHMVIEEAPVVQRQHAARPAYLVALSAHTAPQLKEQARQLLAYCEAAPDTDCGNISYTLLLGRKQLSHRLACVARDSRELAALLLKWLDKGATPQVFAAAVPEKERREQSALKKYGNDCITRSTQLLTNTAAYTENLVAVADLYAQGYALDVQPLFADGGYSRVSLPVYPFAGARYWVKENPAAITGPVTTTSIPAATVLHPLLHQNTSGFAGPEFTTVFNGEEFFLKDHVISGQRIFPGSAYLEMAREAAVQAMGVPPASGHIIKLQQVVWLHPVVVGQQPQQVHIALQQEQDRILFEVYSAAEENNKHTIHSQGQVLTVPAAPLPPLDLQQIKTTCNLGTLDGRRFYEVFSSLGFEYGPSHQCITAAYIGENQLLASLTLPAVIAPADDRFVLHPAILDAAFQASVGMAVHNGLLKPSLPFAIQSLQVLRACTTAMWAFIRYRNASADTQRVQLLDIDLCDETGRVCVRIEGFSTRILEEKPDGPGTYYFRSSWKEQSAAPAAVAYEQQLLVYCGEADFAAEEIHAQMPGVQCIRLSSPEVTVAGRFEQYALRLMTVVQSALREATSKKILLQLLIQEQPSQELYVALAGMLKTARLENALLTAQLVRVDAAATIPEIVSGLQQSAQLPAETELCFRQGKCLTAAWEKVAAPSSQPAAPWKAGGVYLITGGAGGLGEALTREIAATATDITLVLCGRSPLSAARQALLTSLPVNVVYRQADVSNRQQVDALIQEIKETYGRLNGIIHAAGLIRDNFLLKKTTGELQEVFAPKVAGLIHLDEATSGTALDFFLLFSAGAAVMGNPGQADYATANAFMDAYTHYRNKLVNSGERQGKTISVNWPLWEAGGMQLSEAARNIMRQQTGIVPLATTAGLLACYTCLSLEPAQLLVLPGNESQLGQFLQIHTSTHLAQTLPVSGESITAFIVDTISDMLQLSPEILDLTTSFDKFGIDSIMQMNLIRQWERTTGELPKTLMFEHPSIQELAAWFEKHHREKFAGIPTDSKNAPQPSTTYRLPRYQADMPVNGSVHSILSGEKKEPAAAPAVHTEDIAIIGISGRYPLSDNLEELWTHLTQGDNCITTVPGHRWNDSLVRNLGDNALLQPGANHYGGFLQEVDRFDHHLFGIPVARVQEMSPEIRLFLETVWETFENAGYPRQRLKALQDGASAGVGVFVSNMYNQYAWNMPALEQAVLTSNGTDWQIANRVSHFFNLTGPSIAVNSACSGSLTAIHLACESLLRGTAAMAIAGGINLTLEPSKYTALQHAGFLGSGGKSKSFGYGNGYIPGEGVGAVLLKPLSLAIKDNDHILGVIKSSFISHGGGRQRYTAPDPQQQAQLIGNVIRRAAIDPATIGYVESAANGSLLADAIEVVALQQAFEQFTDKRQFCAIGTVKSNIGHLEAASGMSQLTKVLLQMKHKTLAPSINASPRNPNIRLEQTAFCLQETLSPWIAMTDPLTGETLPRRSLINSFGAGGAYAGLIVEEYTAAPLEAPATAAEQLFVFSAASAGSLWQYLESMQHYLSAASSPAIAAIARSLHLRNHNLPYRAAVMAASVEELHDRLASLCLLQAAGADGAVYLRTSPVRTVVAVADLQQAFTEKDLRRLAQIWISGADADFSELLSPAVTPDISIPAYAFDHSVHFGFKEAVTTERPLSAEDSFYQELLEKINKGELTADQFNQLITT
ncbi:SDR family NAD(P)-dependent oxidoreductase [Chitinophaga solisilvae]|uniref:SDR family NAD(P)-dependent oxidoreductase n=1 Tax=Chitinophaga solisilvae TaxID=1233460 RepID=UPI00136DC82D|nr:SDR family NAD(P)-dependent oxidoreductase [Chitinophaga solisilvae]